MKLARAAAPAALILTALTFAAGSAQAAKIISPVSVTATQGGSAGNSWRPANVINQSGLTTKYTAGVTDFDAYIAGNPLHSGLSNLDYLSTRTARSAQLTFDFGTEVTIYKLALWDNDSSSQQSMSISTPGEGVLRTFSPFEAGGSTTTAQVFAFRPVTTRYLTLDITGCGQKPDIQSIDYCGLGEIIFADGTGIQAAVPEPATWAMMILGFGAVGSIVRRRQRVAAFA